MNKINDAKNCPNGHGLLEIRKLDKRMGFRGVDIAFQTEHYVCPVCGIEVGSIDQTAAIQRAISDAYRKKVGLLTSTEIREGREKLDLTQKAFAEQMTIGIASIKRWEGGLIQTKSMDKILRAAFQGQLVRDTCIGNRTFSTERTKLVLREFESNLHRKLLVKDDKGLYAAKYLWYADMIAVRELGQSMTGGTYAALPMGPQLNNYRDLIRLIKRAKEADAEPLTVEEKRIITRIAKTFPQNSMIYKAAHREKIWQRKIPGAIIPYSDVDELTEL